MLLPDYELTLLFNRLQVIRAAVEHNQPQTAFYALNLIELQMTKLRQPPTVAAVIPFRENRSRC